MTTARVAVTVSVLRATPAALLVVDNKGAELADAVVRLPPPPRLPVSERVTIPVPRRAS